MMFQLLLGIFTDWLILSVLVYGAIYGIFRLLKYWFEKKQHKLRELLIHDDRLIKTDSQVWFYQRNNNSEKESLNPTPYFGLTVWMIGSRFPCLNISMKSSYRSEFEKHITYSCSDYWSFRFSWLAFEFFCSTLFLLQLCSFLDGNHIFKLPKNCLEKPSAFYFQ